MTGHRFSVQSILVVLTLLALCLSAPAFAAQWEPLPLWGGAVQVAAAEGDSSIVYAASPAGELYQSADRGSTWQFSGDGPNRRPIQILGIDPHDPRRLYIAARGADLFDWGFFRSENGGRSWQRSDAGIPGSVLGVAFDPETPGRIFAAATFGLYRSSDGGRTWDRIAFVDETVFQVAVAPGDPKVVLASVDRAERGAIERSSDGGETFVQVYDRDSQQFVFDPVRPGRVYGLDIFGKLHRSEDLGATWMSFPDRLLTFQVLAATPAGTLLGGTYGLGVARSLDGGATWDSASGALDSRPTDVIASFAVLDHDILAGGVFVGAWKSRTDGRGWRPARTGIRAQRVEVLEVAPGPTLWVGTQGGFFTSRDGGASFESRQAGLGPLGFLRVLAVHPRRPQIAYAFGCCAGEAPSFGLMKTEDGGRSWRRLPYDGVLRDVAVVEVDPVNPDFVYAGGFFEPHGSACTAVRSTDGGATWSCMTPVGFFSDFFSLVIDPRNPRSLYGLFGGVLHRSPDRGETWERVPAADPEQSFSHLALDPTGPSRLYAFQQERPGVFRSDNGGRSWKRVTNGLPPAGTMHDLVVDSSGRVWIALEVPGGAVRGSTGRVFRSDDAGRHWTEESTGLRGAVVLHLAIEPREADALYAGTAGRGLFRLRVEQ